MNYIPIIEEVTPAIKLSKHERNMIALSWLAEIVLKSLVEEAKDYPPAKKEMYEYIASVYGDAYEKSKQLNTLMEEEIPRVFSEDYSTMLVDVTNAVVNLYETMTLPQMLKVLRGAGIKSEMPVDSYKAALEETKRSIE